ncbi:hypothetical protein BJ875DRAFT_111826 [Amylocarpus encephaloides]|uniref:Uncharacterized protein n=1 Tax=Amylocarpus encephaloides TaxID=45428 RepID=A0A9P8C309_9HELO|nr:hypothetical protein BJ875DRAFT_111826 [Amylocarpus encephaloides]
MTVPTYQTPYSGSPYGASVPTSSAPHLMPNFMPATTSSQSFPMNASNMNRTPQQQHQAQRMQPPPTASTPTSGGMASPFGGMPLTTPGPTTPSQLSTPQNPNKASLQTPNHQQSQGGGHGGTIVTPQTPNFPPGANAGNNIASPLSPGSQSREKERVSLLLDINAELLREVMHLQNLQGGPKKEESPHVTAVDKEKAERFKVSVTKEYVECMRRLQSNLAYLAAIADRSHKPSSQIPPHPAIMFAPSVTQKSTSSAPSSSPKAEEGEEGEKAERAHQDRIELLKDCYKQLQALFPGVDPHKEPPMPQPNPAARTQAQQQQMAQQQKQQQGQGGDPHHQQKIQNDLLRQKTMQQVQQQAQTQQPMPQGMQGMNPQQTQNR